jgi:hypothetical protein
LELDILSAVIASREAHDKITKFIDHKAYTREFQHLCKFVSDYYQRDEEATHVKPELLVQQIAATVENDKHIERFKELVQRALSLDTSSPNIEELVLSAKRRELEIKIASLLAEGGKDASGLIADYQSLCEATALADIEDEVEVLEDTSVVSLLAQRDKTNLIPIYPKALNDRLDGGCERGDNVLLFGMTEIGKSLMAITNAAGWARSGLRTLYLINEDKTSRIATRIVSCLTGLTRADMVRDPAAADELAQSRGFGNIKVIQIIPGNAALIDRLIEKYRPDCVVLDQLRNIDTGSKNNRVVQLEEAATATRNLGKKHNVLFFNITQAGDSARNKIFLDTGDVDFSNVGIPGQMDLMIGFGATDEMVKNNERGIALCKNKISGDHSELIIRVNPFISRAVSQ